MTAETANRAFLNRNQDGMVAGKLLDKAGVERFGEARIGDRRLHPCRVEHELLHDVGPRLVGHGLGDRLDDAVVERERGLREGLTRKDDETDAVIVATGGNGLIFGRSTMSMACTGSAASRCFQAGVFWMCACRQQNQAVTAARR